MLEMVHMKVLQKVGLRAKTKAGHLVIVMACRLVLQNANLSPSKLIGTDCNKE